jgi:hypothetical protein
MRRTLMAAIVACFLVGAGWVAAQQTQAPNPNLLTGDEIGFRVEGQAPGGGVLGTLMVRLKTGEWVEAHGVPSRGHVVPLHTK